MNVRQTIAASAVALVTMGVSAAHAGAPNVLDDGSFTITVNNSQETTTFPGALTFADTTTLAGYSGFLVTSVATISGGSANGNTNPDTGIDNSISNYISSGTGGTETIQFNSAQRYFGLLWGSVDAGNTLSIWNGATMLASYTGSGLAGTPPGLLQYSAPGSFVGFSADSATFDFNKVVLSGTDLPFETVNYASVAAAPEPATWVMLIAGFFGVGFMMRGSRRKDAVAIA